jgi:hypothetical protein
MAKKGIGWAIYTAGFMIWFFGYMSTGHASVFDWDVATPWWISSFVPNLEAELGLALMFASMIPIYWRAGRKRGNLARFFAYTRADSQSRCRVMFPDKTRLRRSLPRLQTKSKLSLRSR